jgi:hypothetical protein
VFQDVWDGEKAKIEEYQMGEQIVTPGNFPAFTGDYAGTLGTMLSNKAIKKEWKDVKKLALGQAASLADTFAKNVTNSYHAKMDTSTEQANLVSDDPNKRATKFKELMKSCETALEKYFSAGYQKGGVGTKKAATKKMVETPVFPVSDSLGYEVIGSYAYGRDAGIADDGVLDQALNADPLSAIDQGVIERYVDALRQWQGHEQGGTGSDAYTSYQNAKANLVTALEATYGNQGLIDAGILREDPNGKLGYHLENFFADQRDSINKLPVANAAYSLADLNFHLNRNDISDIKPMEAGILMEAMSTDFATVLESQDIGVAETYAELDGIEDMSEPERMQALAIAKKRADWEDFQRNIRGKASEVPQRSTLDAINESVKRIQGSADFIENQADAVATAAENFDEV